MADIVKTDTSTKKWYVVRAISGQEKKIKQRRDAAAAHVAHATIDPYKNKHASKWP